MQTKYLSPLAVLLASSQFVTGQQAHGQGALGNTMGPVAFMWPSDRPWSADHDNTAPCGSAAGPDKRTIFPLTGGTVSLSIADDAWNVAFSIAYENDPKTQSAFTQIVSNITAVEAGHQCYKLGAIPPTVGRGSNATLQLEYWSGVATEMNGGNQSFYACADITFVETTAFTINPPCLNVTSSEFEPKTTPSSLPGASSTPSPSSAPSSAPAPVAASGGDGLTTGAKAGIAVGVVVASLLIVGAVAFVVLRKRRSGPADQEAQVPSKAPETASINSARR